MSFFQSDQVQSNLQDIFNTYQEIAIATQRVQNLPREERLEHIDKCKVLIDKQKTFYTRLCLAAPEDSEAADMKTRINALSTAFGYRDLGHCMDIMLETLVKAAANA